LHIEAPKICLHTWGIIPGRLCGYTARAATAAQLLEVDGLAGSAVCVGGGLEFGLQGEKEDEVAGCAAPGGGDVEGEDARGVAGDGSEVGCAGGGGGGCGCDGED